MLSPTLRCGDTVGIISPSTPISAVCPKRYNRGISYLKSRGFKVKEGILAGRSDFYRSGTIEERAEEINSFIRDKEVRCIMSSIGGMNSNSLLPYLDYEALAKDPKVIVGYSDVTALLLGIYAKTGITTFYGPAQTASLGEFPPFVDETFESFMDIAGKSISLPYTYPTPQNWTEEFIPWETQDRGKTGISNELITASGGKAEGRLIGGNLNTMDCIIGTPFMPQIKEGDILFIEDSLKDISDEERSLSHLKLSGILNKVGGIILGKCEGFDDRHSGRFPEDVLLEILGKPHIPILSRFDCGHTHPMLTLPIGAKIKLDADKKEVTIIEY